MRHAARVAAGGRRAATGEPPLRVLVPGAINEQKGLRLLIDCAEQARRAALPLEFWIVGYSRDDARAERAGIRVTGAHPPGGDEAALEAARCERCLAFLPSLAPETWSYALSAVLRLGLHPVVFDLGALAARVHRLGAGSVLPLTLAERPEAVNAALLEIASSESIEHAPRRRLPDAHYDDLIRDYYGGLFESRGARRPSTTPAAPGAAVTARPPRASRCG